MLRSTTLAQGERSESPATRRSSQALRAMEWSEITARLNAARDLRLLLRYESRAPIEAVAASFGDAAARYFALLDDDQPDVNHHALGQSKAFGANLAFDEANPSVGAADDATSAARGDARDTE